MSVSNLIVLADRSIHFSTYNAENVRENPIASNHGIDIQAASAPSWLVMLKSMLRGMREEPNH